LVTSPSLLNSIIPDTETNPDEYTSLTVCGPTISAHLRKDEKEPYVDVPSETIDQSPKS
jgi:hypothetical protein